MADIHDLYQYLNESRKEMISLQKKLCAVPALSPDSGGNGESEKAEVLLAWLKEQGFTEIEVISAPDTRVKSGKRPNIIVTIPGRETEKNIWIMSHLDVVPPGEMDLWENDPYTVVEKDGKIFGRGVEDNQQGLTASAFAALSFLKTGTKPRNTLKLLFAADEETASKYGIIYLLEKHDLFQKGDWFLVPDGGNEEGTMLEVAEKSIMWIRFHTMGKQCHASTPEQGINSFVAASDLVTRLYSLKGLYPQTDPIFDPPVSTFTPTKKENNVPNINTIPGDDVFYMDMRILPSIATEEVLNKISRFSEEVEEKYGVTIERKIIQRVESKPTKCDAPLVCAMQKCIKSVYNVDARPVGIGGGTVGAYLRNDGYDTVVWAKIDETAHMPNEYCIIDNCIGDAKVMATLAFEY